MSVSNEFLEFCTERLSLAGEVGAKRMFGGAMLAVDGAPTALVADNVLYLKVDKTNEKDFAAQAMQHFVPFPDTKPYPMSYMEIPPDIMEDDEELIVWITKAREAGLRGKKGKRTKKTVK